MARKISIIKKEEAYTYDELNLIEEKVLPLVTDEGQKSAAGEVLRALKKSLENQIDGIGLFLKKFKISAELRNMVPKIIAYYSDFQNNHVKHNDKVNSTEIEYIIELTSVLMKLLIKLKEDSSNGQT